MNVDFEERVDFRRLHRYRLGRERRALQASELGAILSFDNNNISLFEKPQGLILFVHHHNGFHKFVGDTLVI